jgi:hypothetical protein
LPRSWEVDRQVKPSAWKAVLTDVHLWAPVGVLLLGLVLLGFMR